VEQARQRIYTELREAPTLAAKKKAAVAQLETIKGILGSKGFPVDDELHKTLSKRLKEVTGKEQSRIFAPDVVLSKIEFSPREIALREIEHIVFVAYDHARQAIRLRQLGIALNAELSAEFVFVPRGYYTAGVLKNPQDFLLEDFFIARTPVTNVQLKRFLDTDEGKKDGRILDDTFKGRPFEYGDLGFSWEKGTYRKGTEHYPVVATTTKTMKAYAAWRGKLLTGKEEGVPLVEEPEWQAVVRLKRGRLSDELEWEAATRGSTRSVYAYGNVDQWFWSESKNVKEWKPNLDLSRATGFESPLGAKWMGGLPEWVYEVRRDEYQSRSRRWGGSLVNAMCFIPLSPDTGMMRGFPSIYDPDNSGGLDIGVGFRPLIPAENFRK